MLNVGAEIACANSMIIIIGCEHGALSWPN